MKRNVKMLGVVLLLSAISLSGFADWVPSDGHKMHYPQMPKVDGGWDVMSQYYVTLADDWQCSESGYVNDIHTWISFKDDQVFDFNTIHLAIYADDPVGDSGIPGEDPNNDYSKPLGAPITDALWHGDVNAGGWDMVLWDQGDQGWYDPRFPNDAIPNDHQNVYQLNFLFDDTNAFWQDQGTVYWLEFSIQDPNEIYETRRVGWKQSDTNFLDAAVWRDTLGGDWQKLVDPAGDDIDLAFVITPEPTTMSMVALASGLAVFIRRRFIS